MAAQVHVGTFTGRNTSGTVAVTGVGFQPKLVLIQAALAPSFNAAIEGVYSLLGVTIGTGVSDEVTQNVGAKWDGVATFLEQTRRESRGSEVISEITADIGFTNQIAELVSFDSDGFTINFSQAIQTCEYTYLAIGGTGVSVAIGDEAWPTSTGAQAVTGIGFEPSLLMLWAGGSFISGENTTDPGAWWSKGWVDQSGNQGVSAFHIEDGVSATNCHHYQRTDQCLSLHNSATGAVEGTAEFVSFDSDGFTLNWTDAHSAAANFRWIAISGVLSKAGAITQPSSPGDQSFTTSGVVAGALLFQSAGHTSSTSVGADVKHSIGFGSVASNAGCWNGDTDGVNFAGRRAVRYLSDAHCITFATPSGTGAASIVASAAVSSISGASVTLTWDAADATAREVLYLALSGEAPVVRGSAVFGVTTTVKGTRAIAFGLDGATNIHDEPGKFRLFGKLQVSEITELGLYASDPAAPPDGSIWYNTTLDKIRARINGVTVSLEPGATDATYLTEDDETAVLTNSRQLLAGTGVTFDDSVPGERTVNAGASAYYMSPLTTGGDPTTAELIFAPDGDVVMVPVYF